MSRIVYSVRDGNFVAPVKWKYEKSTFNEELLDIPIFNKYEEIFLNSGLHPVWHRKELKALFDKAINHKDYCMKPNHKKCPKKISQTAFYVIKYYYKQFSEIIKMKNDHQELLKVIGKDIGREDDPQQVAGNYKLRGKICQNMN